MVTVLAVLGVLAAVAVAGTLYDRLGRRRRGGIRTRGDDTMARYYRDVGDSHSQSGHVPPPG
jgi:hypothetical protein